MYANEEKYERWRQTLLLRALDKKWIQTTSSKGKKKKLPKTKVQEKLLIEKILENYLGSSIKKRKKYSNCVSLRTASH